MSSEVQSAKFEQALVIAGPNSPPQVFLRGGLSSKYAWSYRRIWQSTALADQQHRTTRGDIAVRSCTLADCLQKLGDPAASHIAGSNGLCDRRVQVRPVAISEPPNFRLRLLLLPALVQ